MSAIHAAVAVSGHETIWTFAILQALTMFCFGFIAGNFGAMAMEPMGHIAGTASSAQGCIATVFGSLSASSRAERGETLDLGEGRASAIWRNSHDRMRYERTDGHTFSCYLRGGDGTRRIDAVSISGWPGALCIMPQGASSDWEITDNFEFVHLYVADDELRRLFSETFDRDARLMLLPEATFDEAPGDEGKFVKIVSKDVFAANFKSLAALIARIDERRERSWAAAEDDRQAEEQEKDEEGQEKAQHHSAPSCPAMRIGISSRSWPVSFRSVLRTSSMLTTNIRVMPTASDAIIQPRGTFIQVDRSKDVGTAIAAIAKRPPMPVTSLQPMRMPT